VEEREVLHCIRCGACINACPVFRTVGGHSYGTTYMGPIGSVLTPRLRGLNEFQHLSYASSLCGACTDVCPVKINLHHHLLHNRRDAVNASDRPWSERIGFMLWRWAVEDARRFRAAGWLARLSMRVVHRLRLDGTVLDPARPWNKNHAAPLAPAKSFRALWGKHNGNN
jgi:L-lactate dehydrogenase complex protein LldF